MGLSFFVKTLPGERAEAHITLPESGGSLICGRVTLPDSDPAAGIPVLLLRDGEDFPFAQCLTDEQGLFCFGPLEAEQLYRLSIFHSGERVRRLDIQL